MSGPAKIAKMAKKIGTHNGTFHCDEVLACFMLKLLPDYADATITRTRDAAVLDTCDIVVDVGGTYEPSNLRFDHHQRTFSDTMCSLSSGKKSWQTKLSSAGLVYHHFGHRVLALLMQTGEQDQLTRLVYDKVYENFVQEVDAIDNGISTADGEMRYLISTNLSSRVSHLNPKWNDPNPDEEAGFAAAMIMVGAEFKDRVNYFASGWWPARSIVADAIAKRAEIDSSSEIICLSTGGCPWKEHLFTLEKEQCIEPGIKFLLYADQSSKWRVQAVSVAPGSFENRVSLCEPWRGIRDEKLSTLSEIPGCIFVHANGFIGGNNTYEGALQMARKSLEYVKSS